MLLCCLLLSVGCSVSVSADELHISDLQVDVTSDLYRSGSLQTTLSNYGKLTFYPNNGEQEKKSTENIWISKGTYSIKVVWKFSNKDGNRLFKGGSLTKLTVDNAYYNYGYKYSSITGYIEPTELQALVEYTDGTMEYFELSGTVGRPTTLTTEFTPQQDVRSIEFHINSSDFIVSDSSSNYVWAHIGEQESDDSFRLIIDTQSEEVGLLSGILGWLKNVYDSIVNLPSKLWGLISDGLKSLFVPSEEYLTQFKNDMDALLSEKLGAIYQVVNLLTEGWDRIQANDSTNTIDFPQVTIPLPDNNEFTFGGQTVAIVPEGFDFLVTAIKLIVGICCTILFVNGLKKRYDDIMGG